MTVLYSNCEQAAKLSLLTMLSKFQDYNSSEFGSRYHCLLKDPINNAVM